MPRTRSLLLFLLAAVSAFAAEPARPRIIGLSHVGLWVKDIEKSRAFYDQYLGFAEPYTLMKKDGGVQITWIKINERQTVELFPINEKTPKNGDSLYHIALETDDAVGMHAYLLAHGVKGPGGKPLGECKPGRIGNYGYFCEDPDGHIVEISQYLPDGWTEKHRGQALPDTRIAARISHAGISVGNLDASLRFYQGILGCKVFWKGSNNKKFLSWVNVRLPESNDYLELMLYDKKPSVERLHTLNHFCLEVPDVTKTVATLATRTHPDFCKPDTPMKPGVNQKRQINCYDPDGTRVEVMDDHTLTGQPAPWSTLPAPTVAAD